MASGGSSRQRRETSRLVRSPNRELSAVNQDTSEQVNQEADEFMKATYSVTAEQDRKLEQLPLEAGG
jgi:hypothetical protein